MISFVFPAFNEAANLRRFTSEVMPVFDKLGTPYEILVVDDGSTDATAEVARGLGSKVRLLEHTQNQGLGAALRTGFAAAQGELVITMDTDLTFAPSLVQSMLTRYQVGDADVVSGSPKLAGFGKEIPSYRIFISNAATLVYSTLLGFHISAVSPIFRLYRTDDLRALHLTASGFEINAEILFGLIKAGKRVVEIPAALTVRTEGESKLDYSRELRRHLRLVGRMVRWRVLPGSER